MPFQRYTLHIELKITTASGQVHHPTFLYFFFVFMVKILDCFFLNICVPPPTPLFPTNENFKRLTNLILYKFLKGEIQRDRDRRSPPEVWRPRVVCFLCQFAVFLSCVHIFKCQFHTVVLLSLQRAISGSNYYFCNILFICWCWPNITVWQQFDPGNATVSWVIDGLGRNHPCN